MSDIFHCNECSKYKPIESKCSDLPCCEKCRVALLSGDVSKKTEVVKKEKVLSHALKLKKRLDDRMYQRELDRANCDKWMI